MEQVRVHCSTDVATPSCMILSLVGIHWHFERENAIRTTQEPESKITIFLQRIAMSLIPLQKQIFFHRELGHARDVFQFMRVHIFSKHVGSQGEVPP